MDNRNIKSLTSNISEMYARNFAFAKTDAGKKMPIDPYQVAEWLLEFNRELTRIVDRQQELMAEYISLSTRPIIIDSRYVHDVNSAFERDRQRGTGEIVP